MYAVDGVALKQAVEAWASAPAAEQATRFASAEAIRWLETGTRSYQEFTSGVALVLFATTIVMVVLAPEDVRQQLETRAEALARRLEDLDPSKYGVRRLFLIEDDYRRAVTRAELDWVRSVIEDLQAGWLAWSEDWIRSVANAVGHGSNADTDPPRS